MHWDSAEHRARAVVGSPRHWPINSGARKNIFAMLATIFELKDFRRRMLKSAAQFDVTA
jgi:hypothetical protein